MKKYFSFKFSFLFSTLLLILISESGFAQLAVPFKVRYQSHVKGDMTIIANTIVNRTDSKNATSEPYNDISEKAKLNDEFEMAYIDIDNDETTFSSSSAQLNLTTSTPKKVIYAGLYWSALYKYESGMRDKKWNYIAVDNKRTSVNEIKFKLPGKSDYIDIVGEVLFDGLDVKNFKESAPYAAYADVTRYIQTLENPNGDYTVANIKATQGIISGGVAGGWSLFIVFKDDSETEKFITSFDGFVGITTRPIEISFTGFSTLPEGKVNAKLACAALEGDRNLTGDQLEIKSGDNLKFSLLSHPLKPADNFFNSTIVINEDYFELRNPNSLNTLGYDTCLLQIDNQNNAIIQNNSTKVSLKLKSSGDRYSMFFSAFNVEVSDPLKKIDSAELVSIEKKQIELTNNTEINPKTEPTTIATPIVEETKATDRPVRTYYSIMDMIRESEKMNSETVTANGKKRITVLPGADVLIPRQQKGYYVIANVFAKPSNTNRFVSLLKNKGLEPEILYNPATNLQSVYLARFNNWEDALSFYYSNADGKYFDDLWIMLVNTSTGTILEP
ncbi:hypothetical protein [Flavobacterium sp.]|uniref:hypothetical protein n=1 Tax=Flavobacterium sp. TaxID=239 RepID=UPI0025B9D110|nr:hypothetical protein [Flavobacterium sp.]MBA4153991.1 hypothetical protein [Flavobacterium sp.]